MNASAKKKSFDLCVNLTKGHVAFNIKKVPAPTFSEL